MQCRETSADDGATTTDEELLVEDSCFSSKVEVRRSLEFSRDGIFEARSSRTKGGRRQQPLPMPAMRVAPNER